MTITIEQKKAEGAERLLQVTIPQALVADAQLTAAKKLASKVSLPGFRPGKAPIPIVLKRYADAVRSEALDHLVQTAYKEVLEREKLDVAAQPHIHDLKFEEGADVSFELHLEIRPNVKLSSFSGFRVERKERVVTEEQVGEQLEQIREQRAAWSPISEKPIEGDLVTVVLSTAADDGSIPEGREYKLVLGGGQAIAGIEEVIMELSPGNEAERPVRWPDDFPDESQRGKTKGVRVKLIDVKRKSLPDLDEAFAREVSELESMDALRAAIREDLNAAAKREADAEVKTKLLDEIIGANPFDVPPSWVKQLVDGYANAYQIPEGELERFAAQFRPTAERQVRRDLVIDAISSAEGLKSTEEDLDTKVSEMAERAKTSPGQMYASLQKSGRLSELERGITEEKVFKFLFEKNTVE